MAITQAYGLAAVTVGTAELSITGGTTSLLSKAEAGVYQLWIDANTMAKGDEFIVKVYEIVKTTGGTKRLFSAWSLLGVQTEIFVTPTFILMYGWEMTITKIAGTDRAFDASIRKVA